LDTGIVMRLAVGFMLLLVVQRLYIF
jgi:hypothetical protein